MGKTSGLMVLWFIGLMVHWISIWGKPIGLMVYWFNGFMPHWFQVLTPHVSNQPSCFETPTYTIPCQVSQLHLLIQLWMSCNTLSMLIIEL